MAGPDNPTTPTPPPSGTDSIELAFRNVLAERDAHRNRGIFSTLRHDGPGKAAEKIDIPFLLASFLVWGVFIYGTWVDTRSWSFLPAGRNLLADLIVEQKGDVDIPSQDFGHSRRNISPGPYNALVVAASHVRNDNAIYRIAHLFTGGVPPPPRELVLAEVQGFLHGSNRCVDRAITYIATTPQEDRAALRSIDLANLDQLDPRPPKAMRSDSAGGVRNLGSAQSVGTNASPARPQAGTEERSADADCSVINVWCSRNANLCAVPDKTDASRSQIENIKATVTDLLYDMVIPEIPARINSATRRRLPQPQKPPGDGPNDREVARSQQATAEWHNLADALFRSGWTDSAKRAAEEHQTKVLLMMAILCWAPVAFILKLLHMIATRKIGAASTGFGAPPH